MFDLYSYVRKAISALKFRDTVIAEKDAKLAEKDVYISALEAKLAESAPEVVAELRAENEVLKADKAALIEAEAAEDAEEEAEDATEAELIAELAALLPADPEV
jgi:peptidoglycan hydrolase CwlO-like protein